MTICIPVTAVIAGVVFSAIFNAWLYRRAVDRAFRAMVRETNPDHAQRETLRKIADKMKADGKLK